MATPFTTFPIPTTFAVSEWGLAVNVKDFGAVGDNSADDTAAIQAAIDYACANNRQTIYIPAGNYKTTGPLYLDPPGNLRSNLGSPPQFSFSIALVGDAGLPNDGSFGTKLRPTFNNGVALYVGPGNGMRVANLSIMGPGIAYKAQQDAAGVGVGITGTGGGSSRATFENVGVFNFYSGFKTSANGNGTVGDSNTFVKCWTNNVNYGFYIAGQQNFINSFYDCNPNVSTVGLYAPFSQGCRVFGGNWSNNAGQAAIFPLLTTSAITATPSGNGFEYTFTATLSTSLGGTVWVGNVLNAFAIKTASFGIIPLALNSFDHGTNFASFSILSAWSHQYYPQSNAVTTSDLQAEVQAAPTLYAAELVTAFWGNGMHVHGVHIENAYAVMTLLRCGEGFGSSNNSVLDAVQFNVDPSLGDLKGNTDPSPDLAKFYVQQVYPFINMEGTSGQVTIRNCQLGLGQGQEPVLIDMTFGNARFVVKEMSRFGGPINMRIPANGGFTNVGTYTINVQDSGGGEFDVTPFTSAAGKTVQTGSDAWRVGKWGQHPCWGFRPAAWCRPAIIQGYLELLAGTLPAITYSAGIWAISYPLIWGGHPYSVTDWSLPPEQNYQFTSNHKFYTYGQDLTTTNVPSLSWHYKGQSFCVYANARMLEIAFPGLGIMLNDGVSDVPYMITGVYPGLGYFTVSKGDSANGGVLSGNKTTTFTGTTVKQEPFSIQVLSGPQTAVTKTGDFAPTGLENNIIVNKGSTCTATLPSAALYKGRSIRMKTIQAFTVVSAASNVVPQAGGSAGTAILAATAGKWAQLVSNGTNWEITQSN